MYSIQTNVSLKNLNTFGIDCTAKYFVNFKNVQEIKQFLSDKKFKKEKKFVLGGGSNIIFKGDFNGVILSPGIEEIKNLQGDEKSVFVKVGAGVEWDSFVEAMVSQCYGGVENLSNIPGHVGACPVQNIGAYGVEAKEVIDSVEAIEISTGQIVRFSNKDCQFDYRDSIFKKEAKGKYIITYVTFKLDKNPTFRTDYAGIKEKVEELGGLTLKNIRKAIIEIRDTKLPKPEDIGNAGSTFKNPIISIGKFEDLKIKCPDIPSYPVSDREVKIPAAWLVEQCGWKGRKLGNVGVYEKQAIILVNHGNGTGEELVKLIHRITDSVKSKFGIKLEPEVNIV